MKQILTLVTEIQQVNDAQDDSVGQVDMVRNGFFAEPGRLLQTLMADLPRYKDKIILRPQEISKLIRKSSAVWV